MGARSVTTGAVAGRQTVGDPIDTKKDTTTQISITLTTDYPNIGGVVSDPGTTVEVVVGQWLPVDGHVPTKLPYRRKQRLVVARRQ